MNKIIEIIALSGGLTAVIGMLVTELVILFSPTLTVRIGYDIIFYIEIPYFIISFICLIYMILNH